MKAIDISDLPPGNSTIISGAIAGAPVVYVYQSAGASEVVYSEKWEEIFDYMNTSDGMRLSPKGLGAMATVSVPALPQSVWQDMYILGAGDSVEVIREHARLSVVPFFKFPFDWSEKKAVGGRKSKPEQLFERLEKLWEPLFENKGDLFLFLSAGKDSSTIAHVLDRLGFSERVHAITFAASNAKSEAEPAKQVATRCGIRRHTVVSCDTASPTGPIKRRCEQILQRSPFPCLDNVALAYAYIDPEIIPIGANVIDGSGNDIYIGHVPSAREYQRQHLSFPWALIGLLDALWESHNPLRYQLRRLLKARAEHASLEGGHSRRTVNQMIPHAVEPYSDLSAIEASSPQKDYLSFRAAVRGRLTDQEMFTRKVRNASDVFGWNLILPWAEQATACHIFSMNEHDLFDRDTLRSKLPLREGLYRNIGLNSDDLGKRFFNFNAWENCAALDDSWQLDWASSPVLSAGAGRVLSDLRQAASRARGPRGGMLRQLYSRTFQLMAWLTINEYVQVSKATAAR